MDAVDHRRRGNDAPGLRVYPVGVFVRPHPADEHHKADYQRPDHEGPARLPSVRGPATPWHITGVLQHITNIPVRAPCQPFGIIVHEAAAGVSHAAPRFSTRWRTSPVVPGAVNTLPRHRPDCAPGALLCLPASRRPPTPAASPP